MVGTLRRSALVLVGIALLAPAWLLQPLPARAAGVVTTCNDSGAGSLRAAIVGGGVVTFQAGLNCTGASAIVLRGGTLTIAADTTIDATGHAIVVDGNNAVTVFMVSAGVTATLDALTIQHGQGGLYGGGIANGGTLTVRNSTLSGNAAEQGGGGIYSGGTLTVTSSTLTGNVAGYEGGGIDSFGTLAVTNSTLAGNTVSIQGGAIFMQAHSTATVTNSTLSGNSAPLSSGGGIRSSSAMTLTNTIVANSPSGGDCSAVAGGTIATDSHDLADDGTCGGATVATGAQIDLQPLAANGGPTQTMALGGASVAIDAGAPVGAGPAGNPVPATDQRGTHRPQGGGVDIGAFEVVTAYTTVVNTAADGTANAALCAVGNVNTCRLRDAIAVANGGLAGANPTITFDSTAFPSGTATTITLDATTGTLALAHDVAIDGTNHIVAVDGGCTGCEPGGPHIGGVRVFRVNSGVTASLTGLTIQHGNERSGLDFGSGLFNDGTLTLRSCTITGNFATQGGGIFNQGTLMTVANSTITGNSAGQGGGIQSFGPLTVTDSTLAGNSAISSSGGLFPSPGAGAGIFNADTLTVTNSTLAGNSASGDGSENIFNIFVGGGGIFNQGTVAVTNSTLSGNSSPVVGGIRNVNGTVTVTNTIVAGNTGGDLGIIGVNGYAGDNNLIGDGSAPVSGGGNLSGTAASPLDARLGPLGSYGGPTRTLPLLPGSPAIDAGAPVGAGPAGNTVPSTDQRGVARPQGAGVDIGAFEAHFALAIVGDTNRSAAVNTAFPPLAVVLGGADAVGTRAGAPVAFAVTPAGTGAAATLGSPNPATTDAGGGASVAATANGVAGSYTVTATTPGAAAVAFALTNTAPLVNIAVAPANGTLKVGQIVQYTATGRYADGTTADVTSQVTWTSDAPRTAAVDAGGRATGESPGTAALTAAQGSVSGQATVTVAAPTAIGIAPAPAPANRPSGASAPTGSATPVPAPAGR